MLIASLFALTLLLRNGRARFHLQLTSRLKKMMLLDSLFALILLLRNGRAWYHFAINLEAQEDDANCFTLCTNFAAKKRKYKVPFSIDLEA